MIRRRRHSARVHDETKDAKGGGDDKGDEALRLRVAELEAKLMRVSQEKDKDNNGGADGALAAAIAIASSPAKEDDEEDVTDGEQVDMIVDELLSEVVNETTAIIPQPSLATENNESVDNEQAPPAESEGLASMYATPDSATKKQITAEEYEAELEAARRQMEEERLRMEAERKQLRELIERERLRMEQDDVKAAEEKAKSPDHTPRSAETNIPSFAAPPEHFMGVDDSIDMSKLPRADPEPANLDAMVSDVLGFASGFKPTAQPPQPPPSADEDSAPLDPHLMSLPTDDELTPTRAPPSRPDSASMLSWRNHDRPPSPLDASLMSLPGEEEGKLDMPSPNQVRRRPQSAAARSVATSSRPSSAAHSILTDDDAADLASESSFGEATATSPARPSSAIPKTSEGVASELTLTRTTSPTRPSSALAAVPESSVLRTSTSAWGTPPKVKSPEELEAEARREEERRQKEEAKRLREEEEKRRREQEEEEERKRKEAAAAAAEYASQAAAAASNRIDEELTRYRSRLRNLRPSTAAASSAAATSGDADAVDGDLGLARQRLFGGRSADTTGESALRSRVARIREGASTSSSPRRPATTSTTVAAPPPNTSTWASSAAAKELAEMRRKLVQPEGPAGYSGEITSTHAPSIVEPHAAPNPSERLSARRGGRRVIGGVELDRYATTVDAGEHTTTITAPSSAVSSSRSSAPLGGKAAAALLRLGIMPSAQSTGDAALPTTDSRSPPGSQPVSPREDEEGRVEYVPSTRAKKWLQTL